MEKVSREMLIEYHSNNSGGCWWLDDEDWINLGKAGWKIKWYSDPTNCHACHGTGRDATMKEYYGGKDRKCISPFHGKEGRWLGALASEASKKFKTVKEAIVEFEKITGKKASDEGCNCCSPPHSFRWGEGKNSGYAGGEGCLKYLFPKKKIPKTLREALEKKKK